MGDCEAILVHLSSVFFWGGYKKHLMKQVWMQFSKPEQSRKRKRKCDQNSSCKYPFHFLTKSTDLSHQRLTRCPCSRVGVASTKSVCSDIRAFLHKNNDNLDWKHVPPSDIYPEKVGHSESNARAHTTKKTDLIRASHFRPP